MEMYLNLDNNQEENFCFIWYYYRTRVNEWMKIVILKRTKTHYKGAANITTNCSVNYINL
jgi:hypothetical protein